MYKYYFQEYQDYNVNLISVPFPKLGLLFAKQAIRNRSDTGISRLHTDV